jgi:hypothetical protein
LPVAPFANCQPIPSRPSTIAEFIDAKVLSEGRNVYRARSLAFWARNDSEFDPRCGVRKFNCYGKSVGDQSNWSGSVPVFFGCAPKKGEAVQHARQAHIARSRTLWLEWFAVHDHPGRRRQRPRRRVPERTIHADVVDQERLKVEKFGGSLALTRLERELLSGSGQPLCDLPT